MDSDSSRRDTQGGELAPDGGAEWRSRMQADARQKVISKIMDSLMRHLPLAGQEGLQELKKISVRFEERSYFAATSQEDYLRRISSRLVSIETKHAMANATPSNSVSIGKNPPDPGRQQQGVAQQRLQQSQNSAQFLCKQQVLKQKIQPGTISHSQMQPHIQKQEQQQNLLHSNQLHSSQQSIMQPSIMQSTPVSNLQQNQQSSARQSTQSGVQQHPQPVRQLQASNVYQQQTEFHQQGVLPKQQQHLVGLSNATYIQQNQLIGQQNSNPDMQQQQPSLLNQQNDLSNQQQQLMGFPNKLAHMHQQQSGSQGQQHHYQLAGDQSGTSIMPSNKNSGDMLRHPKVTLQQSQQSMSNSLPSQGQQLQQQSQQQTMSNLLPNGPNQTQTQLQSQIMSQMQPQPVQLHQQLGSQQKPNPLHHEMQQRWQTLQQQQKLVSQPQRAMQEASSTSLDSTAQTGNANGGDWQEEIYQKIKSMKDMYFLGLNDLCQKIAVRLHRHESLLLQQPQSQQGKNLQVEKLKSFKSMLERFLSFLQISKSNIQIGYKDKLGLYEKQIISMLNSDRPRKPIPPMQQEQSLIPSHVHSMQQSQRPQYQMTQLQPTDNQLNFQMQSQNLQGSGGTMKQNMANLQHNPSSPLSGLSNAQQSVMNSLQPSSALGPGQSNSLNSVQQVATGPLQQNSMRVTQQANVNLISSQSGVNCLQANLNSQPSSSMLQKQQEQLLQNQKLKQFQHRQMQQNVIQKQSTQQLQLKQEKLQQPAQMQLNQSPMVHHMSDSTTSEARQLGDKSSSSQLHPSASQRSAYHQQLKPGNRFPISSPQQLQPPLPQISQHGSPQVDQQNMPSALNRSGTPLQSTNSPLMVPSPSTPAVPSPVPGESEKVNSGVSSLSKADNIGHQTVGTLVPAQSLSIGTPGISASPLLDEFSPEAHHGIAATIVSGKSNATEEPLERLIKVVKSMSSKALTASVRDIGSVVSMIDRMAGSAPGNGSSAAVGEDLGDMTMCRQQARTFITRDGTTETKRTKHYATAMPSDVVSTVRSINDGFKQLSGSDSCDLEPTAKKLRIEVNNALLEEVKEINHLLIDTVVNISDEGADPTMRDAAIGGGEGTVVKCSFCAISLSPNLKPQYFSSQMSSIQPLALLVPKNYPSCSPILLDKFPVEVCMDYEDLSSKVRSRFSISLRSLSQPMSIGDIAKTWDICAREVISEYAQQSGGGSFSSKYGTWENCVTAA
ncbi:hypothetical protein ACET3Z_007896 [Daucus carota]